MLLAATSSLWRHLTSTITSQMPSWSLPFLRGIYCQPRGLTLPSVETAVRVQCTTPDLSLSLFEAFANPRESRLDVLGQPNFTSSLWHWRRWLALTESQSVTVATGCRCRLSRSHVLARPPAYIDLRRRHRGWPRAPTHAAAERRPSHRPRPAFYTWVKVQPPRRRIIKPLSGDIDDQLFNLDDSAIISWLWICSASCRRQAGKLEEFALSTCPPPPKTLAIIFRP